MCIRDRSIRVVLYLLAVHTSSSFIVYPLLLSGTQLAEYEKAANRRAWRRRDMTMKTFFTLRVIFLYPYSSTSILWGLRRVVPSAAVTTHAKPHAQKQLARDLEVERAAMGQRCRPQSFGEVQRGNPQQRRLVTFLKIFFICWKG